MKDNILIKDLKFKYDNNSNKFCFGPINIEIPLKSLIFINGNNGSGKSTFVKLLTKKIPLKNFKDYFINVPVETFYYDQVTSNNIFSDLTVKEHLRLLNKNPETILRYFPEMVKMLSSYPDELSGGQKQLLGFCLLLTADFDLIVFDEILNNLDDKISYDVFKFIKYELIAKKGNTVIVISHNRQITTQFNDIEITLSNGKIVSDTNTNEK